MIGKRIILFIIVFLMIYQPIAYANSAGPPGITIISENNPDDLEVYFVIDNKEYQAEKSSKLGESYFIFRDPIGYGEHLTKIIFRSAEKSFEISVDQNKMGYDNLFTLDFDEETLEEGKSILRSIILISSRVILTLIIEGFIFYLFKYRTLRSWLVFLIINLITQGYLNFILDRTSPVDSGYMIGVTLLIFEFFILLAEWILFMLTISEKKKRFTVLYVLVANISSLITGLILLPKLPI